MENENIYIDEQEVRRIAEKLAERTAQENNREKREQDVESFIKGVTALFIIEQKNPGKIIIERDEEGIPKNMTSQVFLDELDLSNTNYVIEKPYSREDGYGFIAEKQENKERPVGLFNLKIDLEKANEYEEQKQENAKKEPGFFGRTFKQIKARTQNFKLSNITNGIAGLGTKIGNKITKKDQHEPVTDQPKPTITPKADARATGPVANYDTTKAKSENLMSKLDEILKKYEQNKMYENDVEIKSYRQKLNEIKSRYDYALKSNDSAEMLNVKTKLVKLSGMIIAKQKSIDNNTNGQAMGPAKDNSKKNPTKGDDEKEPPKRKPKQKKTKPKPITPQTASAAKKTPKPGGSLKAARTRFINQYNKAMEGFDKSITLYTQKAEAYKNEINLLQSNITNIDQIAKDNNFDSRETEIYLADQKEKLEDIQTKLKEVEEQIKQEEEKKNEYDEEYVVVKFKNEFEPDGYIKKKEKRGYAYKCYMQEINLEERIKIVQEVKQENYEIAEMEAKLAEMKAKRNAKIEEEQKKAEEGTMYSTAGYNPTTMDYHGEELEPKNKPRIR